MLWDEVPTGDELGRQQAAAMVDHLNAPGHDAADQSPTDDVVSRIQQLFPGAQVHVGGSTPAPPAGSAPPPSPQISVVASQSSGDPVVRLEKLAQLREAGIVTQEQFEQLRAQILYQAGLD
ncbi:SHOCT domain-containing protein [Gordonia iterans]